ncbi:MAG: sigma-70 family RNA polymerase sigma factor, partial [Candidatus Omnitrophica bacterium]|nr:sigma-70 family RNA polymerase sigma factor [Candidatus Omnitrophota bacterium]
MTETSLKDLCAGKPEAIESARAELAPDLDACWENSVREFVRIGMDRDCFDRVVLCAAAEMAGRRKISLREALCKRMRFPDFYLASAAICEDPRVAGRARDLFSKKYFPLAQRYVRSKWSTVPNAEDRISSMFFCLMFEHTITEKTGNPSKDDSLRRPLLSDYRGQGPLAAWLTLTLGNMIRDSIRTSKTAMSIDEESTQDDGSSLPRIELAEEGGQREDIDRSVCVKMLRAGLNEAWKTLKPREQLTLVLQTLMEVPPSIIARKILNVHEGSITKYTKNGLAKIEQGIRAYGTGKANL